MTASTTPLRLVPSFVLVFPLLIAGGIVVDTQATPLTVVSAAPSGDLATLNDVRQIRIVFSESMVPLGTAALTAPPSWLRISPSFDGAYYWSGSRTLVVSPAPGYTPPFATSFHVRIDNTAASVAGRRLETPFEFTFRTPSLRLVEAKWERVEDDDVSSQVLIGLRFNYPVDAQQVLRHVHVSLAPHEWSSPVVSPEARAFLQRNNSVALEQFEAKVAVVKRVASAATVIEVSRTDVSRLEHAFYFRSNEHSRHVALLTTSVPAPGSWLRVWLDEAMPLISSREVEREAVLRLEPPFFALDPACADCDPAAPPSVRFSSNVRPTDLAEALSLTDVSDPSAASSPIAVDPHGYSSTTPSMRWRDAATIRGLRQWRLAVSPELRSADGQTLGYSWVGYTNTVRDQPLLDLGGWVVEAGQPSAVPIVARNVTSLIQWLAPVRPATLAGINWKVEFERGRPKQTEPTPAVPEIRGAVSPLDTTKAGGLSVSQLLTPRGTGLVWASIAPREYAAQVIPRREFPWDGRTRSAIVQVTNLGLTVKAGSGASLVFVTRLDSGLPVSKARITVRDSHGRATWRGLTGTDGVARIESVSLGETVKDLPSRVITAEKDGDIAFVASNWEDLERQGGRGFDFWLNGSYSPDVLRGSIFTDRRIYRPGDDVNIKTIVRQFRADGLHPLATDTPMTLVIEGPDGEVARRRLRLNRWSSADLTWRLPATAPLSGYGIELYVNKVPGKNTYPDFRASFDVVEFREPQVRVTTSLMPEVPDQAGALTGRIQARFFSGQALATRPVEWGISRSPVERVPAAVQTQFPSERWAIGYMPEDGYDSERGELTLDASGNGEVRVATDPAVDFASEYTLEADVDALAGQHTASRFSTVVHPSSIYIAVARPPFVVRASETVTTSIAVARLDGTTVGDVPVTVALVRERWVPGNRLDDEPSKPGWKREEVPSGTWHVRSAANPVSVPISTTVTGAYILRATAVDAMGRPTRTETRFHLSGPMPRPDAGVERLTLTPERPTWAPGETARIAVHSPWQRATALVTMEREGVRSHRTMAITAADDVIELPLTKADAPNVFVSMLLVKGRTRNELGSDGSDPGRPDYRIGYTELKVEDPDRKLRVTVSSDADVYRPRARARFDVRVTRVDGTPAQGEVTLWAVDSALLTLKAAALPEPSADLMTSTGLGVRLMDNRMRLLVSRLQAERGLVDPASVAAARALGHSGMVTTVNASAARRLPDPISTASLLRHDFRPVAVWLGSVPLSAAGRASTTVTLPDSLTSYTVRAVASDGQTRFGSGEREIRVDKALSLRPSLPRFLATGDRAAIAVIVGSRGGGDVTVQLQLPPRQTLTLEGPSTRQIRLQGDEAATVTFDVEARAAGTVPIRVLATQGPNTDAFEVPLRIVERTTLTTSAAFGETEHVASERVAMPPSFQSGELRLRLASTPLVGLSGATKYLADYPYDCAEQKASRALAFLLTVRTAGALTPGGMPVSEAKRRATALLRDLLYNQCYDGSFALWPGACRGESLYLTAYVLHAMKNSGPDSSILTRETLDQSLKFLSTAETKVPSDPTAWAAWAASQAYAAKVLSEYGRAAIPDVDHLLAEIDRLPLVSISHLADVLAAGGERGPRYQLLIARLRNAIRLAGDRAHLEERDPGELLELWQSDVTSTAVALEGFVRRGDSIVDLASFVRWLLDARVNGHWRSTHEDALVLEALTAYYRANHSASSALRASVRLATTTVASVSLSSGVTGAREISVAVLPRAAGANESVPLTLVKTGAGRLYYAAQLTATSVVPAVAEDRGIGVERHYEAYAPGSLTGVAKSSFNVGDLVRVVVTTTLRTQALYVALTDVLPAGFEAVDEQFDTTSRALAEEATTFGSDDEDGTPGSPPYIGFDRIEKRNERVLAFATRLAPGRQRLSYLVRATSAGTFTATGATVELMYSPDVNGRSGATTVDVREASARNER